MKTSFLQATGVLLISLVGLSSLSHAQRWNVSSTDFGNVDPFNTLPTETMNPTFYAFLVTLLPEDYSLSTNVYAWNMPEIYDLLTADNPDFFYNLPTFVLSALPDLMLQWLGDAHPDLMAHHELCTYLNATNAITYNCSQNVTADGGGLACPEPFVQTNRYSVFYEGCNLECKYWNLLWGMSDDMVRRLDIIKIVSLVLSIPCLIIVLINQYMDSRHSKEWFCQRPFLTQSTLFIVICFANMFAQWSFVFLYGQEHILCQDEVGGNKGVSFGNPEAGWTPCLVSGLHFYATLNFLVLYVLAFTVSLWKQFYAPLRSVWAQAGCAGCGLACDTLCLAMEQSARSPRQGSANNVHVDRREPSTSHNMSHISASQNGKLNSSFKEAEYNWKRSKCGKTCCGQCCISCVCSSNFKYHIFIFALNASLCVAILHENIIDAFHPLGICYGGGAKEWTSWWYNVSPLFFANVALLCFVPAAIYLLCKARHSVASKHAKETLDHLGFRLAFYYFGILFTMAMIQFMAWYNNAIRGPMGEAFETRFNCMLFGGDFDECIHADDFQVPEFTYWFLYAGYLLACLSTVVVTMHSKQIDRWIRMCPCLKRIFKCFLKCCRCCGCCGCCRCCANCVSTGEAEKTKDLSKHSDFATSGGPSGTGGSIRSGTGGTGGTSASGGWSGSAAGSGGPRAKLKVESNEPHLRVIQSHASEQSEQDAEIGTDLQVDVSHVTPVSCKSVTPELVPVPMDVGVGRHVKDIEICGDNDGGDQRGIEMAQDIKSTEEVVSDDEWDKDLYAVAKSINAK